MPTVTFDTLAYSKTLQDAGMPREQADALANAQKKAIDEMVTARELAARADIQDVRLEIEKVRSELLKWQLGIGLALAAIMAKGFGWLGF